MNIIKKMKINGKTVRRTVSVLLGITFMLSAFMTGTYAWSSVDQSALNEVQGTGSGFPVQLVKHEKLADGTATTNPIPGAEFYLYTPADQQVGERYLTDENGKIDVKVKPGNYYFKETGPASGYTYDTDGQGANIEKYPFTVLGNETDTVTATAYNRHILGSLTVTKTVKAMDNGQLTMDNLTEEFTFTVTFSDNGTYDYSINDGAKQSLKSGDTLQLKNGDSAVVQNIPVGTGYTVVESPVEGYVTESSGSSGDIIEGGVTAAFTNMYENPPPQKTAIVIQKIGVGEGFDQDQAFTFTVTVNGTALPDKITLKAGQTSGPIALNVGDSYSVVEDQTVNYTRMPIINGAGTATADPVTVTQTNIYTGPITTAVSGEKTWDCGQLTSDSGQLTVDLPASITVQLKNGNTVVATADVTPDADGKWLYSFADVPKYDVRGNEINYTVEEVPVAGWEASYDGTDIKNIYIAPVTDTALAVQKTIVGTPETASDFKFILTALNGAPVPLGSAGGVKTITINGAGTSDFGTITYTAAGTYTYTAAELNTGGNGYAYDTAVYTYTVTVEEQSGKLAVTGKTLAENGQPVSRAVFTNIYTADKTAVKVTKAWDDNDSPDRPDSVQAQLYKDGMKSGGPVTLNAENGWSYTWTELNKSAVWTVDETNVPEGYTETVSGDALNGFIVTNTLNSVVPDRTSVKVIKTWIDGDSPDRPTGVQAQLYKNGNAYGNPAVLNAGNGWAYTWTGLDKSAVYTVDEINVPGGYSKTVSGDALNGFTITNTRTVSPQPQQYFAVSGKKIWDYGDSPAEKRPASIVVILKADGNIFLQKLIAANEFWSWEFTVPKYADDGHEIHYTIDEARVDDYTKEINGYNITNTYSPDWNTDLPDGTPNPPSGSNVPKTGGDNHMAFWVTLMAVSAAGLAGTVIISKKMRKKYIPEH